MPKVPMTEEGYRALRQELDLLKKEQRPAISAALAEARAHGDLSENAEYQAAKEKQGRIEARIARLSRRLGMAEVIRANDLSGDEVRFGAWVTIRNATDGAEDTYQIVGSDEADLDLDQISLESPIAKALLGKRKGMSVEVETPAGTSSYTVTEVSYRR